MGSAAVIYSIPAEGTPTTSNMIVLAKALPGRGGSGGENGHGAGGAGGELDITNTTDSGGQCIKYFTKCFLDATSTLTLDTNGKIGGAGTDSSPGNKGASYDKNNNRLIFTPFKIESYPAGASDERGHGGAPYKEDGYTTYGGGGGACYLSNEYGRGGAGGSSHKNAGNGE